MEHLFDSIVEHSKNARQYPKFDGKKFWQGIKDVLAEYDSVEEAWKPVPPKQVKYFMRMDEYTKNGYGEETIIESNHFAIQQVRIPSTEPATIRKIMQVALNIGQAQGMGIECYEVELRKYVPSRSINALDKILSKDVVKTIEKYMDKYNYKK